VPEELVIKFWVDRRTLMLSRFITMLIFFMITSIVEEAVAPVLMTSLL